MLKLLKIKDIQADQQLRLSLNRKKILLILVIIIATALFLEGATRVFLGDKLPNELVVPTEIGQFDERLGWSKIPNSRATSKRTGYEIEYLINSKGLRDSETTYEKPEGTFRIVLVGDSHTFGYGVPIEKHYSTLLEGYFKDVEVINMGVDGYGVDQELIYLQLEGFKYEPDLILAYIPHFAEHRHMHINRFGKNKPRFLLVDGELELTNYPVVDNVSLLPQGILRDFHHWLLKQSVAYQIFQNGVLGIVRQGISQAEQKQQDENNSFNEKFVTEMNELGEELIVAMYEDSLKHGATFVLVTRMEKLQESALVRQVISVNISRSLSNPAFSLPGNLKHENESGNGVIAWEIAKFLQNNHLIPAEHLKD